MSLASLSTHKRSFRRWVFAGNRLHLCYNQPHSNQEKTRVKDAVKLTLCRTDLSSQNVHTHKKRQTINLNQPTGLLFIYLFIMELICVVHRKKQKSTGN